MPLRPRTQLVVRAKSAARTHVLPLYVHARECDLPFFHEQERLEDGAPTSLLLDMLDADADFQALVQELDNVRGVDELIKSRGGALHHVATPNLQAQWFIQDHPHSLVNVLQRSHRRRDECFAKRVGVPVASAARGSQQRMEVDPAEDEYTGGMYRPLPVRRLAITVWLYPPHVAIPPTGDHVPENAACTTDFFQAND